MSSLDVSSSDAVLLKSLKANKINDFVTPFLNNGIPVAHFSQTGAYRFTELTYRTIKNLVLPRIDFLGPIAFCNKKMESKNPELGSEVYALLLHAINTISPMAFDAYYDAFQAGKFYECFLILQRLYSVDSDIEKHIMSSVLFRNRKCRREYVNAICFVDVATKDVFCIDIPNLYSAKKCGIYLPRQVLKFEELVQFSFDLDEAIMCDLEYFCPLGLKQIYAELVKRFYKLFDRLPAEQRILQFLRIKFFVFNSIGLSISFLSSGPKQNILELLIRTAKAENDAFFRSYAIALGLLTK